MGYSKRISRPNFHHINAYQIVNPVFEWEYNPSIAPEFSHNVELDYLKNYKKASFRLGVFYRYKTDLILWTQRAENNIQVFRYENADNEHSYGAEADLSVDLFDWLSTSATANFYYSSIQSDLVTWDRIYSSRLKVKSQFKITKFLSSDITYNYLPQQQRAFSFIKSRSRVDWAFNSSLFGGKVNANLRIIDLFNTNIIDRRSEAIDLEQETSWDIQNLRRSYVLSLAYTPFSKSDFKRTKKRRRRQEVPVD